MAIAEGEVAGIPARVVPRQLLGRARVRGERRRPPRARAVGGDPRRGRRDAVRHRGDARAARREGLPDRRPGHRRHRHAAGPRHGLDRLEDEARLPRQALVRARRHRAAPTASSSSACCRSTATRCSPRARSSSPTPGARAMLGHVTSSYRSAALGRHVRARAAAQRPRADRRDRRTRTASRPRSRDSVLYDREGTRRDGRPDVSPSCRRRSTCAASRRPASRSSRTRPPRSTARTVLWLGPDEWLVLGATEADFADAAAAVDVSANRVAFELVRRRTRPTCSRRAARSTSTVEPPGGCAQTLLARAQVILYRAGPRRVRHPRPPVVRRLPPRVAPGRDGLAFADRGRRGRPGSRSTTPTRPSAG